MPKRGTNIISVFGQIEGLVADALVAEGKATRIATENIPPTVRWNADGVEAHCALVITPENEREYDQRVKDLRA